MEEEFQITIGKYREEDLVLRDAGIWIFSYDRKSAKEVRLPNLNPSKQFIFKNQLAKAGGYIYIPQDQIKDNDMIREVTKPIAIRIIPKWKWKQWKDKFKYEV